MKNIESQKEKVNHLLQLIEENPDLKILPMVDTECVFSDEHGWWLSVWGEATIDEYYISDERVFIKSEDYEELTESWSDNNYEDYSDISDDELEAMAKTYVDELPWEKAILVGINAL